MVQQGNLAGASSLAKAPGVLKPSVAGSQIRHVGQGSEGLATLVAHPEHGVAVRKLYDPHGISSPGLIQAKEQAGRAIGTNPHVAQFYGSAQAPHGNPLHFSEYVPSAAPTQARPLTRQADEGITRAAQGTQDAVRGAGFSGGAADVRQGNMIEHAPGQFKSVDYMPMQAHQVASGSQTGDRAISVSPQGYDEIVNPMMVGQTNRRSLMQSAFRGQHDMGPVHIQPFAQGTSASSAATPTPRPITPPPPRPFTPTSTEATYVGVKKPIAPGAASSVPVPK
jgi:hypothetical protein